VNEFAACVVCCSWLTSVIDTMMSVCPAIMLVFAFRVLLTFCACHSRPSH
jgi:hypothetical protein